MSEATDSAKMDSTDSSKADESAHIKDNARNNDASGEESALSSQSSARAEQEILTPDQGQANPVETTSLAKQPKKSRRTIHSKQAMKSSMTLGVLLTCLGAILWGFNGTLAKIIMNDYNVTPLWFSSIRQISAGILYLVCALIFTPYAVHDVTVSVRNMGRMLFLAVTCVLFVQLGYLEVIDWTNPATATVLQTLQVIIVIAWMWIRTRKRPRKRDGVGALLALAGVYLLATGGDPTKLALPWQGLMWGLVDATACAAMCILPVDAIKKWGSFTVNALTFLISGIIVTVIARPWDSMPALDGRGWALLAASIVLGTFAAFACYLKGVSIIGAVRGTMIGTLEPLTAAVTSVTVLGMTFTSFDVVGFIMIIAMVFITA